MTVFIKLIVPKKFSFLEIFPDYPKNLSPWIKINTYCGILRDSDAGSVKVDVGPTECTESAFDICEVRLPALDIGSRDWTMIWDLAMFSFTFSNSLSIPEKYKDNE